MFINAVAGAIHEVPNGTTDLDEKVVKRFKYASRDTTSDAITSSRHTAENKTLRFGQFSWILLLY